MEKIWKPNETQTAFLKVLENYPNGATLRDIEIDTGLTFKTGAINTLTARGMVEATDTEVEVNLVYRDTVIGQVKKTWKTYRLVRKD